MSFAVRINKFNVRAAACHCCMRALLPRACLLHVMGHRARRACLRPQPAALHLGQQSALTAQDGKGWIEDGDELGLGGVG
jgi:hypothetical protein